MIFKSDQDKDNDKLAQIMRRIDKTFLVVDKGVWVNKTKVMADTLKTLVNND